MAAQHKSDKQYQERLEELYAKIKEFEQKAKDLRSELDEELEGLKNKDSKLYQQFDDLKHASSAAFYDIRQGLDKAAETMREAIRKATYHFK